jgi:hypothetical protein
MPLSNFFLWFEHSCNYASTGCALCDFVRVQFVSLPNRGREEKEMVVGGLGVRLAFVPVTDNKTRQKKFMVRVEAIDPLGPAAQVVCVGVCTLTEPAARCLRGQELRDVPLVLPPSHSPIPPFPRARRARCVQATCSSKSTIWTQARSKRW